MVAAALVLGDIGPAGARAGPELTASSPVAGSGPERSEPSAPGAGYAWPLAPRPAVVRPFRPPADAFGPGHRGVDLAGVPGRPVLAARGGTVAFAGVLAGRGVVSVQHPDGLRTTYEPVSPAVAAGAVVRTGDVIGRLDAGHPGCSVEACLHWGVLRARAEYVDPLVLLRPARIRLRPVPVPWPGGDPAP